MQMSVQVGEMCRAGQKGTTTLPAPPCVQPRHSLGTVLPELHGGFPAAPEGQLPGSPSAFWREQGGAGCPQLLLRPLSLSHC